MIILFLQTSIDRFSIIPTAVVSILDGEFITQLMPDEGKTSSVSISNTVEPLNKGHIGTSHFVHYREVVLFLMYSGTPE